jgi:hypothetical protein
MELQDLRTNEITKHSLSDCKLQLALTGIPTSNVEATSSLGFKITLTRLELINLFNCIVDVDETIENAVESAGY